MSSKVIFFDLGGTLVTQNIENNIVTSKALKEISQILPVQVSPNKLAQLYLEGYRINQRIRSQHHVEIPIETWMFRLLRKAIRDDPSDRLLKKAVDIVVTARAANTATFPDSLKAVKKLKQIHTRLGALSNVSSHTLALAILRTAGMERYFDHIVTSAIVGLRKPDPGIFRAALTKFRINPDQAVIVGDSEHHDVEGGYISGLQTVLVDRRELEKDSIADYRFTSLEAALPVLETL